MTLLRAELLHRAKAAIMDQDRGGALTNAWMAIEGLLGDEFKRYLDDNEDRTGAIDPSGNAVKFIDRKRRDFLEGAEMTARLTAEFLSLADRLPFHLYRATVRCGKARNDWLHAQKGVSHEDAHAALLAAGELFELVEGVPLRQVAA